MYCAKPDTVEKVSEKLDSLVRETELLPAVDTGLDRFLGKTLMDRLLGNSRLLEQSADNKFGLQTLFFDEGSS